MSWQFERTVAFLDHSIAPGGAQLALTRVLAAKSSARYLFIPKEPFHTSGVYSKIESAARGVVQRLGPEQPAGATGSGLDVMSLARYARRICKMAYDLRRSPEFRASEIVHANSARSAVYGSLACIFTRKKLIIHLRDMTSHSSLGKFGFLVFVSAALRRADGVIANSDSTLRSAAPFLPSKTLTCVIPSPIGLSGAPSSVIEKTSISRVGMVARIDSWKGQDIAIKAFAEAYRGESVELLFAGAPLFGKEKFQHDLELLAEDLGVSTQVKFLGHVEDIEAFILTLDICLQTSTRPEPLGQNVLQYLKLGRPTIAMNEGGPAEWIVDGHNGILVEPRDVSALSEAMKDLGSDAQYRCSLSNEASQTEGILTDAEVSEAFDLFYGRVQTGIS